MKHFVYVAKIILDKIIIITKRKYDIIMVAILLLIDSMTHGGISMHVAH